MGRFRAPPPPVQSAPRACWPRSPRLSPGTAGSNRRWPRSSTAPRPTETGSAGAKLGRSSLKETRRVRRGTGASANKDGGAAAHYRSSRSDPRTSGPPPWNRPSPPIISPTRKSIATPKPWWKQCAPPIRQNRGSSSRAPCAISGSNWKSAAEVKGSRLDHFALSARSRFLRPVQDSSK